ncbi:MAG: DinB family protein [Chloroflexi bacterium]|nr:DinB family protein [Chloroflexota bacterium]
MDLRDYIAEAMTRVRQNTLNSVQGLTPEQLRWQPGPEANSIGFLLFHAFRVEDLYFHRWIQPVGEIWVRGGWQGRYKLSERFEVKPEENGNSWNGEQVAAFIPPPLGEFLAYAAAVRESALKIVKGLDLARLGETPNPNRPNITIANMLQNAVAHEAEHRGTVDYLVGLMKAPAR